MIIFYFENFRLGGKHGPQPPPWSRHCVQIFDDIDFRTSIVCISSKRRTVVQLRTSTVGVVTGKTGLMSRFSAYVPQDSRFIYGPRISTNLDFSPNNSVKTAVSRLNDTRFKPFRLVRFWIRMIHIRLERAQREFSKCESFILGIQYPPRTFPTIHAYTQVVQSISVQFAQLTVFEDVRRAISKRSTDSPVVLLLSFINFKVSTKCYTRMNLISTYVSFHVARSKNNRAKK